MGELNQAAKNAFQSLSAIKMNGLIDTDIVEKQKFWAELYEQQNFLQNGLNAVTGFDEPSRGHAAVESSKARMEKRVVFIEQVTAIFRKEAHNSGVSDEQVDRIIKALDKVSEHEFSRGQTRQWLEEEVGPNKHKNKMAPYSKVKPATLGDVLEEIVYDDMRRDTQKKELASLYPATFGEALKSEAHDVAPKSKKHAVAPKSKEHAVDPKNPLASVNLADPVGEKEEITPRGLPTRDLLPHQLKVEGALASILAEQHGNKLSNDATPPTDPKMRQAIAQFEATLTQTAKPSGHAATVPNAKASDKSAGVIKDGR